MIRYRVTGGIVRLNAGALVGMNAEQFAARKHVLTHRDGSPVIGKRDERGKPVYQGGIYKAVQSLDFKKGEEFECDADGVGKAYLDRVEALVAVTEVPRSIPRRPFNRTKVL